MTGSVVIDCFPESAEHYRDEYAIVAVDVIRATSTATVAAALGREVYPAATTDEAFEIAERLHDPLLVGELGGHVPYGFDLTNSPVQVVALSAIPSGYISDPQRPLVLVSSSGTNLIKRSIGAPAVYLACARNFTSVANYLNGRHDKIAVLGAGTRGRFRREDQMICAWVAERLVALGYAPLTGMTTEMIERWRGVEPAEMRKGQSADYLRNSGQLHDLEYVVHHIDDLDVVPQLVDGRVVVASGTVSNGYTLDRGLHT